MFLDPIFERFVAGSPLSMMARATMEHALNAEALDALFERTADRQYTQDLLFSSLVELMSLTVCGVQPHIQAAFQDQAARIPVTLKSVYEKLKRVEPQTCAALVRFAAERCGALVRELGGGRAARLPGWRLKILDGNHLAATEHRLNETRRRAAAPLPGLSLVLLDPELGIATDVLPCEDGHAQERSLLSAVLERVEPGDAIVADRNFCTADFLAAVAAKPAAVVIRHHANLGLESQGEWGPEAAAATGWVSERPAVVVRDGVAVLAVRCVRLRLARPTRDGDREVRVLTNLPAAVGAAAVAELYRGRWSVETMFQELTQHLGCEVSTLCYPRAALFGFSVAVVAYNVLAVVKAALRAAHGAAQVEAEVSGYYLALELARVSGGLMIALPAAGWQFFRGYSAAEMATQLRAWALRMDLRKYQKHPRAPKKPQPARTYNKKEPHVSTAQLLKQRKRTIT